MEENKKKLYFAVFHSEPKPRIVVVERDADFAGGIYRFEPVSVIRSRVAEDEVGHLLDNSVAVADDEERAVEILRESFRQRAQKLERKAKKLLAYSCLKAEYPVRSKK